MVLTPRTYGVEDYVSASEDYEDIVELLNAKHLNRLEGIKAKGDAKAEEVEKERARRSMRGGAREDVEKENARTSTEAARERAVSARNAAGEADAAKRMQSFQRGKLARRNYLAAKPAEVPVDLTPPGPAPAPSEQPAAVVPPERIKRPGEGKDNPLIGLSSHLQAIRLGNPMGRPVSSFASAAVRGPTTWTITRHDGPNHRGL